MLKWLQYETVLGPEDGEAPRPAVLALAAPGGMMDEEKAIGSGGDNNTAGGMLAVSGPGLGDLHTEPAITGGVSVYSFLKLWALADTTRCSTSSRARRASRTSSTGSKLCCSA